MEDKKKYGSSFWVKIMRFAAYANIVCGCLVAVIVGAVVIISGTSGNHPVLGVVMGLLSVVIGVFFSLLGSAAIMVFLDMANDIRCIRGRSLDR